MPNKTDVKKFKDATRDMKKHRDQTKFYAEMRRQALKRLSFKNSHSEIASMVGISRQRVGQILGGN